MTNQIQNQIHNVLEILSKKYCDNPYFDLNVDSIKGNFYVGDFDRGPRIDHGGGSDGDDWMDDCQQEDLYHEYFDQNKLNFDRFIRDFEEFLKGLIFNVEYSMDYGEKGHIGLGVYFNIGPIVEPVELKITKRRDVRYIKSPDKKIEGRIYSSDHIQKSKSALSGYIDIDNKRYDLVSIIGYSGDNYEDAINSIKDFCRSKGKEIK